MLRVPRAVVQGRKGLGGAPNKEARGSKRGAELTYWLGSSTFEVRQDDAERDTNHAIAHQDPEATQLGLSEESSEGRFAAPELP